MSSESEERSESIDVEPMVVETATQRPNATTSKTSKTVNTGRVLPDSLTEFLDEKTKDASAARKQYLDTLNYTTGKKLVGLGGKWACNPKYTDRRFTSLRYTKSMIPEFGYLMNQTAFDGLTKAQMIQMVQILFKSRYLPKLKIQKRNGRTTFSTMWYGIGKENKTSAEGLPKTLKNDHILSGFENASRISKPFLRRGRAMSVHSRSYGPVFKNPTKSSFVQERKKTKDQNNNKKKKSIKK